EIASRPQPLPLSLHDALPIYPEALRPVDPRKRGRHLDRDQGSGDRHEEPCREGDPANELGECGHKTPEPGRAHAHPRHSLRPTAEPGAAPSAEHLLCTMRGDHKTDGGPCESECEIGGDDGCSEGHRTI